MTTAEDNVIQPLEGCAMSNLFPNIQQLSSVGSAAVSSLLCSVMCVCVSPTLNETQSAEERRETGATVNDSKTQ